jgi:Fur family zinc uptake transcriptional regulator
MNRTRNEALVYEFLESHGKPASAYGILDALRQDGLKAPLQVYRALS